MNRRTRIAIAAIGSFAFAAYIALIWLTAALGGPWQLVAVIIFVLCAACTVAVFVLARLSPDDPTVEPDEVPLIDEGRIDRWSA